ncbi:peptidoglycan bridge formation glycyltransferase FemA/FemB family protein [Candidatus Dojkabacteria bacterium]|uniref:Peptidoglycan bridge formation glycyltransferase FemA/FemB family protein n=1 Tax=Candidatus Dojkabacteria bacterium TaxID=2099670 RepID=A0A955L3U4_9BACT|nr:peptidoglycan bridge formation glycyltransferase FemA/FemB family protein [Candidatus Dojkabacteria bacterium]
MAEFREITEKMVWENFLLSQKETPFLQSWCWGAVQEKEGFKVHRIGIYNAEKLAGIVLAVLVKAKRGNFFHIRQGPVLESWSWDLFKELTNYLQDLGKREKADFVRIVLPLDYSEDSCSKLKLFGYKITIDGNKNGLRTLFIDLTQDLETIKSQFRKNTRYYVNRAEKKGVQIRLLDSPQSDISEFLKLLNETGERKGFFVDKQVEDEFREFSKNGDAVVVQAEFEGGVLAAGLYIYYGKQGNSHYRGTSKNHSELRAANLLHWKAIELAKEKGKEVFNLWGVAPEDDKKHPWAGFSEFKRGFSKNEKVYIQVHDLPISKKYYLTRLYEQLVSLKRGY